MAHFEAQDPDFEAAVRRSFDSLTLMKTVGARLLTVAPGEIEVDVPFRDELTQHHGFLAAAVLTAIADVACGYAAMSLMPPGASVLTIEYKVNFLSPAQGERMLARGRVIRPGRTVTVCAGDVVAVIAGTEKLVATMLATMATVSREGRDLPRPGTSVATTHDHRTGSNHPRSSSRAASAWCVCRGGGLRRQLKAMVGFGT
jgi:uncharacterized protein (TIGR00369 family)